MSMGFMENAKMCAGYERSDGSRVPYRVLVLLILVRSIAWEAPLHLIALAICKRKGCDWENQSWGNPESGGEAATCKRCGYSFSVTYY